MDKGLFRRIFLVLLMLLGGVLMIAGALVGSPSVSVAGAGAWVLVIIALLWGMRFRFEQASLTAAGLRDEFRDRFERIRESQLKLHSRVALQKAAIAREHESFLKQVRRLLEDCREASNDAQRLTLRAYRESQEEWTRVAALLAAQEARGEEALRTSEGMFQQLHMAVAEELPRRIKAVEDLLHSISTDIGSVRGEADQSTGMLKKAEAALDDLGKTISALDQSWTQGKSAIILKQKKSRQEILQSIEAITQLNKLVDLKAPYPLLDGWAMDPISMLSLLQQVMSARPRLILECGSGTSTVWLAAALRKIGSGRLVSLDHLEDYARQTRAALAGQGLEGIADVRSAPLVQVEVAGESVQWYDPVTFSDVSGVDLLVVDGPPKAAGPQARYPALPLVASKLSDGALIVLDDTDRPEEAEILERWQQSFPELSRPSAAGPRTAVMEWRARTRGRSSLL